MHTPFIDNIWGSDLPDVQFLSRFNKGDCLLLYFNATLRKYDWVVPLRYKKSIIISDTFQKILNESGCKWIKIYVGKGCTFFNKSLKS